MDSIMTNLINPELIQLLACPNCRNHLLEVNNQLRCIGCSKEYEIRNGIPLLYPDNKEFEQSGYLFVNFDLVYEMLYTQQQNFGAKTCVAGDITSLPFKKNSFDYVVCVDVLHNES